MDTSETYIKMCERAEEIQEMSHAIVNDETDYYHFRGTLEDLPTKGIWLPRQDQLQEMVNIKTVEQFSESNLFAGDGFYPPMIIGDNWSMEQFWLSFVMKERWNKTWNCEDWT